MRSVDKRVSTNIPNIFWKTKFKQINQIHQQVSFALCRTQTKGKKLQLNHYLTSNKDKTSLTMMRDTGYSKIFAQAHHILNTRKKNKWQ